ncbi:MAG: radical SAM protein [Methanomicrobiales archaeon]|nr:radical SAM protein [Methanomicrobiales archaeon]
MLVLSKGCILCHSGAKMVLFVTGVCTRACWYCPISAERRGNDMIYANEHRISSPDEMIRVAETMSAEGTGVTGGEPLLVLDRVMTYCTALKDHFGTEHHIHLYTGIAPSREELRCLRPVIDEIRFHPPQEIWSRIEESDFVRAICDARDLGFSVGIEVPSLPGLSDLIAVLPLLDFLNINELEWSETNADAMRREGMDLADSYHNAVRGAGAWAKEIRRHKKVHWCSSTFKDSVQLRERLKRIARNTARPFDEITDDGTIVYGVLKPPVPLSGIDDDLYAVYDDHIEMAWWILAEERQNLPGTKCVVERYPDRGMIVEVTPL